MVEIRSRAGRAISNYYYDNFCGKQRIPMKRRKRYIWKFQFRALRFQSEDSPPEILLRVICCHSLRSESINRERVWGGTDHEFHFWPVSLRCLWDLHVDTSTRQESIKYDCKGRRLGWRWRAGSHQHITNSWDHWKPSGRVDKMRREEAYETKYLRSKCEGGTCMGSWEVASRWQKANMQRLKNEYGFCEEVLENRAKEKF